MRVLNKYTDDIDEDAIWIMRPSILGNPFTVGRHRSRDQAVDSHLKYARKKMKEDPEFRRKVLELRGHNLVCCCSPRRCHGDNYILLCEEFS